MGSLLGMVFEDREGIVVDFLLGMVLEEPEVPEEPLVVHFVEVKGEVR